MNKRKMYNVISVIPLAFGVVLYFLSDQVSHGSNHSMTWRDDAAYGIISAVSLILLPASIYLFIKTDFAGRLLLILANIAGALALLASVSYLLLKGIGFLG